MQRERLKEGLIVNKIKAVWRDGKLMFAHFIVKKDCDSFFGVYQRYSSKCGPLITSDTTLKGAAKKAKLLEMGCRVGVTAEEEWHKEDCRYCSFRNR